jgi:putative RNA 2'-phosphotransferase
MTKKAKSKFLSYVLRHNPNAAGIALDPAGWVRVEDLLSGLATTNHPLDRAGLERIVAENDKKRFTLSNDGQFIRAAQGHSVPVALDLEPVEPPKVLHHGTATRFLDAIRIEGLKPGSRQQVHLSADVVTAQKVGERHGKPHILELQAALMWADGYAFYLADNEVWLTDFVPPQFLSDCSVR